MKAIILASGSGKRLRPLTNDRPKPLVKINHQTILEYQLDTLSACNIRNIVITTGPFEDQIKDILKNRYSDLQIECVNNPKYDSTNYIYSLWLTKDLIDDDIILIHGDLIFTRNLIEKIIKTKGNVVLVNKVMTPPEKDFKAVINDNRVEQIGVDFFGEKAFLSLPLYKFEKNDFLMWMTAIENEIRNDNVNCYAEDAFNNISHEIMLKPLYFTDEFCMEIDTKEDLKKARAVL